MPMAMAAEVPLEAPPQPGRPARLGDGGHARSGMTGASGERCGSARSRSENPEVAFMDGLPRVNVGMSVLRG